MNSAVRNVSNRAIHIYMYYFNSAAGTVMTVGADATLSRETNEELHSGHYSPCQNSFTQDTAHKLQTLVI